ncbi:FliH/SctL family protein [Jatrophihabitans fulvus]
MPSSPELVEAAPEVALPRWEALELRAGAPALSRAAFEAAFPTSPATGPARTESFVVSSTAAVPEAVLADARRAARSAGYADGYAHGAGVARLRAEAEAAAEQARCERAAALVRAEAERALQAVHQAQRELAGRTAVTLADVEHLVLDTAFRIAEQIVGRSVADDPQRGRSAVARALALVPEGHDEVTVALYPDDLAALTAAGTTPPEGVRLVADPSLAPGDAIATADATTVDARIAAGLARVREVLGR